MVERQRLKAQLINDHPDLVVTTYEAYTAEAGWFKHRRWSVCVLDEGCVSTFCENVSSSHTAFAAHSHKIKNHESNVAQGLHGIGAQMRIILSGTPLQNNLIERASHSFRKSRRQ